MKRSTSTNRSASKVTLGAAVVIAALATADRAAAKEPAGNAKLVQRGEYLVVYGGCHDCHSPKKMGANGMPELIPALALSGHPAEMQVTPAPSLPPGPWIAATTGTMTAWSGPWGISYAANLTPDPETGLGKWTEQNFVEAMRTGRHMGRGRPILPPMPVTSLAKLTDGDLKAIFAYLRSLPPVKNRVADPAPPEAAAGAGPAPGK